MDLITASGVTVSRGGRAVLRDVSLSVAHGEVVALLAPSGAGKTTLLRAIVRFEDLDAGVVRVDGEDVTAIAPPALRRRVGLVAQSPVMLPGSVADNLAHGLPELSPADAREALEAAGLDASFGARAARELSGGEQARVAVARALTRSPSALLLDEPTAALDTDSAERLGATLGRLRDAGLGVCVATHDRAFADRWCDRWVQL